MNKTESAVLNAYVTLILIYMDDLWHENDEDLQITFLLRKRLYELVLSEERTVLYLKDVTTKNDHGITHTIGTWGIDLLDMPVYADTLVKEMSRKIIAWERQK